MPNLLLSCDFRQVVVIVISAVNEKLREGPTGYRFHGSGNRMIAVNHFNVSPDQVHGLRALERTGQFGELSAHVRHLFKGRELGHLCDELPVFHGLGGILVLKLRNENLQKIVFAQILRRLFSTVQTCIECVNL